MTRALHWGLLLAAACTTHPKAEGAHVRAQTAVVGDLPDPDATQTDPLADLPADTHGAETRVLVILGSARADHSSVCGGRARMPFLESVRDNHHGVVSCATYASSPWNAPALASLLTDQTTTPPRALAAELHARGFTTRLVSARPDLQLGDLGAAFDSVHIATTARAWRYPDFSGFVHAELASVAPESPLLLVVVLADAEAPYAPVPRQRWGRNQDWMNLVLADGMPDPRVRRLSAGVLSLDEEERFLLQLAVGYDHGLELADANTRALLAALRKTKRDLTQLRLVVVGDHGTALGERALVGTAALTYEFAVRVPLVALDTATPAGPPPSVVSTRAVPHWLLDGAWDTGAVTSVAHTSADGTGSVAMASAWSSPSAKLSWLAGSVTALDLAADPGELSPVEPAPDDTLATALRKLAQ